MTSNDELIASARAVATAIRTWLSVGRRDADRIDAIADRLAALGRDRDLTAAENRDLLDENMKLEARLAALTTPQEGDAREQLAKLLFVLDAEGNEEFAAAAWSNHPNDHAVKKYFFRRADAIFAAFPVLSRDIAGEIEALNAEILRLQKRNSDMSWALYPDRMGQ